MRDYLRKCSVQPVFGSADTKPVTRVFIFSNCMRVRQNLLLLFHTEEGSLLKLAALPGLGASSRIKSKIWLKKVGNQLPMSNVVFLQTVNIKFAMHGHAVDFWFMFTSPVLKRFCSLTQLNTSCRYSYTANFKRNPKKERMRGQVKTLTQSEMKTVVMWFLKQSCTSPTILFRHLHLHLLRFLFHRSN